MEEGGLHNCRSCKVMQKHPLFVCLHKAVPCSTIFMTLQLHHWKANQEEQFFPSCYPARCPSPSTEKANTFSMKDSASHTHSYKAQKATGHKQTELNWCREEQAKNRMSNLHFHVTWHPADQRFISKCFICLLLVSQTKKVDSNIGHAVVHEILNFVLPTVANPMSLPQRKLNFTTDLKTCLSNFGFQHQYYSLLFREEQSSQHQLDHRGQPLLGDAHKKLMDFSCF